MASGSRGPERSSSLITRRVNHGVRSGLVRRSSSAAEPWRGQQLLATSAAASIAARHAGRRERKGARGSVRRKRRWDDRWRSRRASRSLAIIPSAAAAHEVLHVVPSADPPQRSHLPALQGQVPVSQSQEAQEEGLNDPAAADDDKITIHQSLCRVFECVRACPSSSRGYINESPF